MTKQNIIIGAIAVIALLLGGWAKLTPSQSSVLSTNSFGNTSIDGTQTFLPNPSNFDYLVGRLAVGFGTNTSVSATGVGNVVMEAQRMSLVSPTSTPCAIQNPTGATSTVLSWSMNVTVPTSTAMTWALGTSTTQYATTTTMATLSEASNGTTTLTWDPGVNNAAIGPSQWVVIGAGAGTAASSGAFSPGIVIGGTCQAMFMTAN